MAKNNGLSTTRYKNLNWPSTTIRITFDKRELQHRYKIKPIHWFNMKHNWYKGSDDYRQFGADVRPTTYQDVPANQYEERIISDDPIPLKYIKGILILSHEDDKTLREIKRLSNGILVQQKYVWEEIKESITNDYLYHGTRREHDFTGEGNVWDGIFFSTAWSEAHQYGDIMYRVTLRSSAIIFDTGNLRDCRILLNHFGELVDDYYDEDSDRYYIRTPEQLHEHSDSWNAIEQPNVLHWLNDNYDGVVVYEGGVENILIFNPILDSIVDIKNISGMHYPEYLSG